MPLFKVDNVTGGLVVSAIMREPFSRGFMVLSCMGDSRSLWQWQACYMSMKFVVTRTLFQSSQATLYKMAAI